MLTHTLTNILPSITQESMLSPKSIWSLTPSDVQLFSQRVLLSPRNSCSDIDDDDDDYDISDLPLSPIVDTRSLPSSSSSQLPFFGQDNFDPQTIVIAHHQTRPFDTSKKHIQSRFANMRSLCNRGYGIVPISNTFTEDVEVSDGDDMAAYEFSQHDLYKDIMHWSISKRSSKNVSPPTPQPPIHADEPLVLFQIGFLSGRQGLFQGKALAQSGEHMSHMIGMYVILYQDDGMDIGILRAYEPLLELVRHIPEVPYMPILRRAQFGEIARIRHKIDDECVATRICKDLLRSRPTWARGMQVEGCEFQYDRHKLVVYAKMKGWQNFNAFVKALHSALKTELGHLPRVFIQRRFAE